MCQNRFAVALVIWGLCLAYCATPGYSQNPEVFIEDPNDSGAEVNPLGVFINEVVAGPYGFSIDEFNAHPYSLVLTIEPSAYPAMSSPISRLVEVALTEPISSVDLTIGFSPPPSGFGALILESDAAWVTSGTQCLAYASQGTSKITFDQPVYGVGFTVNRLQANMTVKILDVVSETDPNFVQIGSDITVPSNAPGGNHSFIGYYNSSTAEIRGVEFGLDGAQNQFSLDDIVFIYSTEGLPECYLKGEEGDINEDCWVNLSDFGVVSANWLSEKF